MAADAPARAHVFVDDVDAPVLSSGDAHHLRRVLRLRPDEIVAVSDGAGRARPFRFGPPLEPAGDASYEPAPSPAITVAFALTKGESTKALDARTLIESFAGVAFVRGFEEFGDAFADLGGVVFYHADAGLGFEDHDQ